MERFVLLLPADFSDRRLFACKICWALLLIAERVDVAVEPDATELASEGGL